jgi:hypothetical protein
MVGDFVGGRFADAAGTVAFDKTVPSAAIGAHRVKEQSDCETGSGSVIGTEVGIPFEALLF